jgi:hypothetical protein
LKHEEAEQIMSYEKLNIPKLVHSAQFPVYGLIDHPDELSICSVSRGGIGEPLKLNSIGFIFSSPRYSEERDNFVISSAGPDIEEQGNASIIHDLKDPSEGPLFDFDTTLFQYYRLSEKERTQVGSPSVWEGTFSIADIAFSAKIRHWSSFHKISLFLLKAEKSFLTGQAYGPSYDELMHLLLNLQIINNQENVLRRYQYELDQETDRLFRI